MGFFNFASNGNLYQVLLMYVTLSRCTEVPHLSLTLLMLYRQLSLSLSIFSFVAKKSLRGCRCTSNGLQGHKAFEHGVCAASHRDAQAVVVVCVHVAGMCHDYVCVCVTSSVKTSVVFPAAVPFSHLTQEKEDGTALTLTSTLTFTLFHRF